MCTYRFLKETLPFSTMFCLKSKSAHMKRTVLKFSHLNNRVRVLQLQGCTFSLTPEAHLLQQLGARVLCRDGLHLPSKR